MPRLDFFSLDGNIEEDTAFDSLPLRSGRRYSIRETESDISRHSIFHDVTFAPLARTKSDASSFGKD